MKKLDRELGLLSVVSIACGAMLSGLFVLPGHAALIGGPSIYLAFLLAGLLFLPAALSKAEMATALPEAGGDYIFIDRAMGPMVSTITGMGTWLALMLKSAFALVGLSAYLFLLVDLPPGYLKYFACGVGVFLIVINCLGVKKTGQLQTVLVVISLVTLLVFVERGAIRVQREFYEPFLTEGWLGFISATAFVFVSYAGVTKVASAAEEVENPGTNIPWGMLLSLTVMTLLYTAVVFVTMGVIPMDEMAKGIYKNAPIAQAALEFAGRTGEVIISVVAVLALAAMANAGLLASSRYPLAMARYDQLPELFNHIHSKFGTPILSIIVTGGCIVLSIIFLPVIQLAKLASAFMLLVFSLVNLSVIIFREGDIEWYRPEFKSPFYPYVQLFGIVSCLALIGFMGWLTIGGSAVLIGIGLLWYFAYARKRVDRKGAVFQEPVEEDEIKFFREARSRSYTDKESVIVPFFELDRTEMLQVERRIRLAASLCDYDERLDVVHFAEVPEFSFLSDYEFDHELTKNVEERVELLRGQIESEIHFDQVVTHNSRQALVNYAKEERPHWVVLGWAEPSPWQEFFGTQKWWLEDFPCDQLLFDDRGSAELKDVLVLTEPGPYDGEVVYAADHIAQFNGGTVTFLNSLKDDDGEREVSLSDYQKELRGMCRAESSAKIVSESECKEEILKLAEDVDLLLVGGLTKDSETGSGLSEVEGLQDIIDEAPCSVARVRSNLFSPQTVLDKRKGDVGELSKWLDDEKKVTKLQAVDKDDLFRKIARDLSNGEASEDVIYRALWDREQLQDTYIENRVAFPHAISEDLSETNVKLYVLEDPIPYTEDDHSVQTCVVTTGPLEERREHLEIIGQMADLLNDKELRKKLTDEDMSEETLTELLREKEVVRD